MPLADVHKLVGAAAVAARAPARAAGAGRRSAPKKRKVKCCSGRCAVKMLRRTFALGGSGMLGVAMLCDRSGLFASLGATAASVAALSQDTAAVAARLAEAGSNVTVHVVFKVVRMLDKSITMGEELWSGVDLTEALATRKVVRAAAADAGVLMLWVGEGAGGVLPRDLRDDGAAAVANISVFLPVVHQAGESFDLRGVLTLWEVKGKVLPSGYRAIVVIATKVVFTPRWSNFFWEGTFDCARESYTILANARILKDQLSPIDPALLELSDAALENGSLPKLRQPLPPFVLRLLRHLFATFGKYAWLVLMGIVVGAAAVSTRPWVGEHDEDVGDDLGVASVASRPHGRDASSFSRFVTQRGIHDAYRRGRRPMLTLREPPLRHLLLSIVIQWNASGCRANLGVWGDPLFWRTSFERKAVPVATSSHPGVC